MGTRADFYVGVGESCEWLGSIAWDGYPRAIPNTILNCTGETDYRLSVASFLFERDDATFPVDGWPWPWEDSRLTDYAYTFVDGVCKVVTLGYGPMTLAEHELFTLEEHPYIPIEQRQLIFKDMSAIQNVTLGPRSGIMILKASGS